MKRAAYISQVGLLAITFSVALIGCDPSGSSADGSQPDAQDNAMRDLASPNDLSSINYEPDSSATDFSVTDFTVADLSPWHCISSTECSAGNRCCTNRSASSCVPNLGSCQDEWIGSSPTCTGGGQCGTNGACCPVDNPIVHACVDSFFGGASGCFTNVQCTPGSCTMNQMCVNGYCQNN